MPTPVTSANTHQKTVRKVALAGPKEVRLPLPSIDFPFSSLPPPMGMYFFLFFFFALR
jgi:hypothetical protein